VKRLDRDTARPVRVQLPASALRSAPVVDRGGQPIAGAWVWPFGEPGLAVRSDALGVCRLEASTVLLEGALLAAAPGFLTAVAKVPGPPVLPAIVLTPAVSLSGVVVDAAGRPQAGARLETVPLAESASLEEAVLTRASAAGEFRVSGLAAGRSYRITAHHPGSASGVIALGPVETSVAGLRVVMRRGAALTGALIDERGEPAAGVTVELLAETGRSLGRTATDGEGRFALSDLPPGRGELVLGRPGAVPVHRPGIEIPEGRTVDLGRLLISGGTTLAGRVTDPDGSPLADVEVQVRIGAGANFSPLPPMAPSPTTLFRHTAADGTFSFSGLEPEQEIHLALCHERSIHEVLKLPAVPPEPLELTLRPAAQLSGVIVDAEGSPVPYAFLSTLRRGLTPEHRDPDAPCSSGEEPQAADADGRFALTPFVPGWYSLIADAPGFQAGHLVIEVSGAGRDDLRIVLESAPAAGSPTGRALPAEDEAEERREVRGHVLSPDGRPVAGATVVSDGVLTGTAEDGSFLLSLTDGEHPVRVKPGEYSSGWQETQVVVTGSPVDGVEIRLQATAELRGRISGLEPAELAWARVWAQQSRFEIYPGQVAADGSYRISRLTPVQWTVEVQAGDRKAEQELVLAPGEREAAVDLELAAVSRVSGWVTGPAGEPLPGSTVVFRKDGHTATATAGSDGSFALRLPEGSYTFNAYGGGYHLDGADRSLEVAGPVGDLEMRLVRGTELHGRVVGLGPGEVPWIQAEGPSLIHAELEMDGTFRLLDLDPGTWTVTATLETEDGKHREVKRQVTVREGDGDIDLTIDLALDPQYRR
jgi:protocatechuate 3,4-dioxygenase beta subunit